MNLKLPKISRVNPVDKLLFTKHMGVMLKSGIPLPDTVEIIAQQSTNPYFKSVLLGVQQGLNNGQSLKNSLAKYPHIFDSLYLSIIAIGEESGTLESNLAFLATQLQRNYDFRRKIQGAMLYPSIVLATMILAGTGISLFVLPKLVDLLTSLEVDLPLSTRILLGFATLMKNHGLLVVGIAFGSVSLIYLLIRSKFIWPRWQRFMLSWPIFGQIWQQMEMAQFCRNLGIMLKSGLPISSALLSCVAAEKNEVYKSYIHSLHLAVERGQSISKELSSGHYPLIPLVVTKMIGVGETSGRLDEVLLYLADFFEEEVDTAAKNIEVVLEPILLFVIAIGVAFLAISIITPIYKFSGSIGGTP
jgi:type IV pilus assembly protein PilC